MKITFPRALLLLVLGFASVAHAQLSKNADYFGKIGSADVWIVVNGDASNLFLVLVNSSNGLNDSGNGVPSASGSGSFVTDGGLRVAFQINASTVTGTVAGNAFTALRESDTGPQSAVSGVYSCDFQDRLRVNTDTYAGLLTIYPSGRVLMAVYNSARGWLGVGSRNAAGDVVIPAAGSNVGATFRFSFTDNSNLTFASVSTSGLSISTNYTIGLTLRRYAPMVNLATRAFVGPGQLLTGGFVITDRPKTVLIRAVGPTLKDFGVPGANADPQLTLYSGQSVIASNDNWGTNANASEILTAAAQSGAFALTSGSKDAVLMVRLQPGGYTAQASSVGTASGDAILEIYEITK